MVLHCWQTKGLMETVPFSYHIIPLYILQCPWSPFTYNSRSHGCMFPSEDANGIHSSSHVYNPNPGPQASRAREGWARDKSFVPSFSISISSSLFWVKMCFILFHWQRGGREVKSRKGRKQKTSCGRYFRSGFWLQLTLRAIIFQKYGSLTPKTEAEMTVIGAVT